jgi:hypothetical protein
VAIGRERDTKAGRGKLADQSSYAAGLARGSGVFRAELPAGLASARQARSAVREALAAWDMEDPSGDAELLASELVANVARAQQRQPDQPRPPAQRRARRQGSSAGSPTPDRTCPASPSRAGLRARSRPGDRRRSHLKRAAYGPSQSARPLGSPPHAATVSAVLPAVTGASERPVTRPSHPPRQRDGQRRPSSSRDWDALAEACQKRLTGAGITREAYESGA